MGLTNKQILSFVRDWEETGEAAVCSSGVVKDFKSAFFAGSFAYEKAILIQEGRVSRKGKDLDFLIFGDVLFKDDNGRRFIDALVITNPKDKLKTLTFIL